jgi:chromosome segregation ATPase
VIRSTVLTYIQKSKEHTEKIESLTAEADRLRKECATLKERLGKLPAIEQANDSLSKDKADLLEQLGKLSVELTQAKESCAEVNRQLSLLTAELQVARSQNDVLRSEKSDLMSKQQKLTDQTKNATQAVTIFKNENATLKSVVDKVKANQSAPAVGGAQPPSSAGQAVLEQQVQDLTEQKETLQKALEEWTALAKVSTAFTGLLSSNTTDKT